MNIKGLKIAIMIFLISSVLSAHGNHKKKMAMMHAQDTLTIVAGDTIAINGIATKTFLANKEAAENKALLQPPDEETEEPEEITFDALFEHIHNKVIHFPIALTVIGFVLMLLGYKDDKYLSALKIIIPFAAIMTVVAVFAGLAQVEPFEGTAAYGLVVVHKYLGFSVLTSLILWSITLYAKKWKKFVWLFASLTLILVSIAGLYGGVIAH